MDDTQFWLRSQTDACLSPLQSWARLQQTLHRIKRVWIMDGSQKQRQNSDIKNPGSFHDGDVKIDI